MNYINHNMRYGLLSYWTDNLGDEIQSIASRTFLPRVDRYLERDYLANINLPEKHLLICNGWWMWSRDKHFQFPFNKEIRPLFISVHLAAEFREHISQEMLDYFAQHGPVGCRDRGTQRFLEQQGISAYFSSCLTLTLPPKSVQKTNDICLVDVPSRLEQQIPADIINNATRVTHTLEASKYPSGVTTEYARNRLHIAQEMLDLYARSRLIITGRIHCALPALALGTPVIFLSPDPRSDWNVDRLGLLEGIIPTYSECNNVDWSPGLTDISSIARPLKNLVTHAVKIGQNPMSGGAKYPDDFMQLPAL